MILAVQLAVIILLSRLAGALLRRLGQPPVVGEITAGLLLGPSVLGALAPDLAARLFPAASLPVLQAVSTAGLLFFMLLVGADLDLGHLRSLGRVAVITSNVSVVVPFLLGVLLACAMHPALGLTLPRAPFAVFLGAAMSVTAFPVLARILTDKGLLRTRLGLVAIACAAADDVTAWCLLAGITAWVRAGHGGPPLGVMLGALLVFLAVAWLGVRPALERHLPGPRRLVVGVALAAVFSAITSWIGVHAMFGAFVAGLVLPRDPTGAAGLRGTPGRVTTLLLLPVFFAISGLKTNVRLLGEGGLWLWTLLVIAVAVAGKMGAGTIAARIGGFSWRDALGLGALMNTRGLVELVMLGVGLELGVIDTSVFSMMVLMALVTTAMAGPILEALRLTHPIGASAEPGAPPSP